MARRAVVQPPAQSVPEGCVVRKVRAIEMGYGGLPVERLHYPGDEFDLVVHPSRTPPRWVEFLDEEG